MSTVLTQLTPVVQLLSHVQLFVTPWTASCQASLSITISQTLLKFMSIESVMPSITLCLPASPPALNPSQIQCLFQWVGSLHQVAQNIGASASATVLAMNNKGSFPLGLTGLISLLSKGLSRVFSNTAIQKHQFFGTQTSLWSNSHICIWLQENHSFDYMDLGQQSDVSAF